MPYSTRGYLRLGLRIVAQQEREIRGFVVNDRRATRDHHGLGSHAPRPRRSERFGLATKLPSLRLLLGRGDLLLGRFLLRGFLLRGFLLGGLLLRDRLFLTVTEAELGLTNALHEGLAFDHAHSTFRRFG
jgi:hypothetical protein